MVKLWLLPILLLASRLPAQTPMAAQEAEPVQSYENERRWEQIDDLEGRFRILTPGPLEHKEDTLVTAVGEQVFHTYFFKVPDLERAENLIYVLSYVDYPEGALNQDSTELVAELLSSTEESAAEALRGEVIYATDREVRGHPGRLWRIDYKDGEANARTLAFVIGRRYYELKTFSLAGRGLGDASDKFFRSFEYLPGSRSQP
ncbi:hypothetical protein CLV84_3017 [Neolewinella xylanilytica]|uniref:Outer membrane lipoprotein-sorting protein n=1 Tax=Neolewinella xylanilytica TaxID=1514080 RepID=A0A2S6I4L7_9BACT|nr:hypothetical protein [Neolewinella xylanilytica]PPK86100.1 hypothetical protein CLV84_3017 [Neolewinella xylanilytica]